MPWHTAPGLDCVLASRSLPYGCRPKRRTLADDTSQLASPPQGTAGRSCSRRRRLSSVELALTDLGDHRFKDIPDTVSIFRLGDDDSDPDEPLTGYCL